MTPDHRSGRKRRRSAEDVDKIDPTGASNPTREAAKAENDESAKQIPELANKVGQSETLVLRSDKPPADQRDFDDRHDTRATESDELARRYAALRKERRKDDWHNLAVGLIWFIILVIVYLIGFALLLEILPALSPYQAAQVVGLAYGAAGGGMVVRSAGRALKRHYDHRPRRRSDSS